MRNGSSSSVRVFSADARLVEIAVTRWAGELRTRHPEIVRVIWFGSWIHGTPTPRSDVDLCLVLEGSDKRFRDRIPDYLPDRFPVDVQLFPYTVSEFARVAVESPSWYREIMRGREV